MGGSAGDGDGETEGPRRTGAVWPPPPTGPSAQAGPLRPIPLIHLPLFFPKPQEDFRLPKWAKSAWQCFFIATTASLLGLRTPVVGKVVAGLCVFLVSGLILSSSFCAGVALYTWAAYRLGRTTETLPPKWCQDVLSATGGWMGLVPDLVLWAWGLFYLAGNHVHLINRIALVAWVLWFFLGCGAAVVKGIRGKRARRLESRHGPRDGPRE